MHLKDKIAIVTGGSRGIGKEICLKFASLGANLVINYIGDKTQAEDTKAECEKLGAKVALSEGDVSKMADCEKLFQTAMDTFGRVDILVNNAGITRDNLLMRMSEEEFDAVIAVNLKGTFNCMKQAARPMMKQKYGATHLGNTVFFSAFIDFYIYPFQLTSYINVLARIYFLLRPARNIS